MQWFKNLCSIFSSSSSNGDTESKKLPPSTSVTGSVPQSTSYNFPVKIAVINATTVLTDEQVKPLVEALQVQVSRDFAPVYGVDAKLTQVMKGQKAPSGMWQLVLLDNSDQSGALGYHDLTSEGLPLGKCFIKTDMQYGATWSVTVSHELLEMLGDSEINLTVFVQSSDRTGSIFAREVCDSPEADVYAYEINGVKVSDFVYPAWFGGLPGTGHKYDHMGHINQPLQLLPGGYIGKFDVTSGSGWTQMTAEKILHQHRNDYKPGSRRERRARGQENWKKSTS